MRIARTRRKVDHRTMTEARRKLDSRHRYWILAAAVVCTRIKRLDYSKSVEHIRDGLNTIRHSYLRFGTIVGFAWWLLWIPLAVALGFDAVVDPMGLLPPDWKDFYFYEGSFTTPPCTEGVKWVVLQSRPVVSKAMLAAFPFKGNFRPPQPLNGRVVLKSSSNKQ